MFGAVYACITQQHDLRLVALAACLCLFSCFAAGNLFLHAVDAKGRPRHYWHAAAAFVFGAGVWSTHFIAMLAYEPGIPVGYDFDLTVLSIVIAMVVTWLGMSVALRFGEREAGGAIIGVAVGAMHYTGMAALRLPADIDWNFSYVGVSLAIGICCGAAAVKVLTDRSGLLWRVAATLLFVLAICGLHFIAMTAIVLRPDSSVVVPDQVVAPELLAVAISAVTILIVTVGLSSSFVDDQLARRAIGEAQRLAQRVEERTAELRQTQAKLLHQERLSALGELTATIAHELRNPMGAASNTIFTIKQLAAGAGLDLTRPIGRLERSIARCERIIDDLLDFSSLRDARRRPVAIDEWLETVLDDRTLPEGVTLTRALGAKRQQTSVDAGLLRRVIENLIENAIQAIADSGGPTDRRITVASRVSGDQLEISVADTGTGIPASVLPRVFDPLFSTKSFGTGLGLPVAKEIVEQHGGTIAIASVEGSGTTVTLRIPAVQTAIAKAA
jgi:NO-binding membrane sensor protein with MHYT domain/anti-sigma regulatory factor (Ser/Thr protein kinase)